MRLPQSTKSSDRKGPTKEFGSVAQLVELRSRDPRVLIGVAHFVYHAPMKSKEDYNEYMNSYMKNRYKKRREEALAQLGGKCVQCGAQENLEIDHIIPSDKGFTLAKKPSCSLDAWNEELAKCQLLCTSCHKQKHSSTAECGTPQKYWRGCRCLDCTKANTEYNRAYRESKNF